MSQQGEFLEQFQKWLAAVDEAYLIGIANKGIYNRAVKELGDGSGVEMQVLDERIQCTFPDEQTCQLTTDIKTNKCTCPSRSICKHTLMGLLYVKEHLQTTAGKSGAEAGTEPTVETLPDFTTLLSLTKKELKKFVTDKVYQDLCYRIRFGVETQIEESSMLSVQFIDEGITVRFPPLEPVRDAICSCKSIDFCRHRVEAVMHYQLYKGAVTIEQLEDATALKIAKEPLQHVKRLLEGLLIVGASRMAENALDQLEQMAVVCHSSDLPHLEKMLRGLKTEAELYINKHASASQDTLLTRMTDLYNTVIAIENTRDPLLLKKWVGEHKSSYIDVPPLELIGMGAGAFRSKAGFEGISYYFYNEKLKRWLTFTHSRPTYYEGSRGTSLQGMYRELAPWGVEATGAEFSKSRIRLLGGKMSTGGRLSSSEQSTGRLLERKPLRDIAWDGVLFEDWAELLRRWSERRLSELGEREEQDNLFLLHIHEWSPATHFDTVEQVLYLPISDSQGNTMSIRVPYSQVYKSMIEKVERYAVQKNLPPYLLGRVDLIDGELVILPISLIDERGQIDNLTLDKKEQKENADA